MTCSMVIQAYLALLVVYAWSAKVRAAISAVPASVPSMGLVGDGVSAVEMSTAVVCACVVAASCRHTARTRRPAAPVFASSAAALVLSALFALPVAGGGLTSMLISTGAGMMGASLWVWTTNP
jgi:hypothetical protein